MPTVRINDTFDKPDMATDLFEYDLRKLNMPGSVVLNPTPCERPTSKPFDERDLMAISEHQLEIWSHQGQSTIPIGGGTKRSGML